MRGSRIGLGRSLDKVDSKETWRRGVFQNAVEVECIRRQLAEKGNAREREGRLGVHAPLSGDL